MNYGFVTFASQFSGKEMGNLSEFGINILSLENKQYEYEYRIDHTFFRNFENTEIKQGNLYCRVLLDKTSSFIRVKIHIKGWIELICDRSLDPFNYDIETDGQEILKFGPEEKEIDDEVSIISRNRQTINLAQPIYEFISISVPMKKLHPRYQGEEENTDGIIYTTAGKEKTEEEDPAKIDPRWEKLIKLKNTGKD